MAYENVLDTSSARETIKLGGEGNPTSIEGYFLGTKIIDSDYGPAQIHAFQTKKGVIAVWGKTIMNSLLANVPKGEMTLVAFAGMGEKKKGKNPAYLYTVKHDPENKLDASTVDLDTATSVESDEDYVGNTETEEEPVAVVTKPLPKVTSATQSRIQSLINAKKGLSA